MKFDKSLALLKRAEKIIPVCSQTLSKGPNYLPKGAAPVYLKSGQGSHVFDVDGNEFVDYILGLGPITLGYNYIWTNGAIINQLQMSGIIFSLPHPLEVELSELLVEIIPCAEKVRFTKTGSEATSAAVKIARAYTNRDKIAFRGYHGWHDWYSISTERPKGIPIVYGDFIHKFEYNDIKSLEALFTLYPDEIACVIMEPVIVEKPYNGFLDEVKELTHQNGALLIFDETVTGFRFALGGAQEYFNVIPDLATFGKGMANGMPLGAVVGKAEIMRECEDIFFSSTFGGECLSLAASLATITEMRDRNTIDKVWNIGRELMDGINKIGFFHCVGYPWRPIIDMEMSVELKTLFLQEMIEHGILIHNNMFLNICYSHTREDVEKTLEAFEDIATLFIDIENSERDPSELLKGELVNPAFRRL